MDNVNHYFASLDRLLYCSEGSPQQREAFTSKYGPRPELTSRTSPLIELTEMQSRHSAQAGQDVDFFTDNDPPLDAFDKQLLSESPQERQWQAEQGLARISLPPRSSAPAYGRTSWKILSDDRLDVLFRTNGSSSSPPGMRSSPTISALQNRVSQRKRQVESRKQPSFPMLAPAAASHIGLGRADPIMQRIPLTPPSHLPDRFRSLFPYPTFNAVQSKCLPVAFGSDENFVVSAPTGSGKTVLMELAICHLMASYKDQEFKVIYQAPTKSLCAERYRDWHAKFGTFDLQCAELTGDTDYNHLHRVQTANIIITTPEKWDSVTRKWKDNARLMEMVRLFLIDEVHILKEYRGATLEAVVSRMKSVGSKVRFVALSATIPNSEDIAAWLGKNTDAQHLPAYREVFGEEFRPVRLQKIVKGYSFGSNNDWAFEGKLTENIPGIIEQYSRKKPTMIFCFTKTSAAVLSKRLADLWHATSDSCKLWDGPKHQIRVGDKKLRESVSAGVAFHHGGLDSNDRRAVEQGFLSGDIKIICCTSTLAVGVNLPCYLVIIKGTVGWSDHGAQEYPDLEIMQMLGRAGRPQFESSACAVILTRQHRVQHYERMVSGEELLESCLHLNLVDHLNAEIGLGTVYDIPSAKRWLAGTFLFVRLRKNPGYYQLKEEPLCNNEEELLERMCKKEIKLLCDSNLVSTENRFKTTEFGDAMAKYYVKFETMKILMSLPPKARTSELLSTIAKAVEFRDLRLKSGEKALYKAMNNDARIRFPIKVDIALPAHKVSLLIQTELGCVDYPDSESFAKHQSQYRLDKAMVFSHVQRLIRCITDCQIRLENSVSARHAFELGTSLAAKAWDNTPMQLKQLEKIGPALVSKLAAAGIQSLEILKNTEPHRIEMALGRNPPFGKEVLRSLDAFPTLRVSVKQIGREREVGKGVKIKLRVEIGFMNQEVPHFFQRRPIYVCFLAETSHGQAIDFRKFGSKKLLSGTEFSVFVQLTKPTTGIKCYAMCDEIAGTTKQCEIRLDDIPTFWFPNVNPRQLPGDGSFLRQDSNMAAKSAIAFEDSSDRDLTHGNFLAAAINEEKIDVIEDIDEILANTVPISTSKKTSLKRTLSQISGNEEKHEDADIKVFREPQLLKNGRWTCQHDCNEKGSSCKHVCCRNGVAKPKKAPKQAIKDSDRSAGSGKEASKKPGKKPKSPFEVAQVGFEEKKKRKQKQSKPNEQGSKKQASMTESTKSSKIFYSDSHAEDLDMERGQWKRKLSFKGNPYGFAKDIKDDGLSPKFVQRKASDAIQTSGPETQLLRPEAVFLAAEKRSDFDEMESSCFDDEMRDNDWHTMGIYTSTETGQPRWGRPAEDSDDDIGRIAHDRHSKAACDGDSPGDLEGIPSDFFDSDIDLGAFEAPLSHVNLENIEKRPEEVREGLKATGRKTDEIGLFITGEVSSPYKTPPVSERPFSQFDPRPDDSSIADATLKAMPDKTGLRSMSKREESQIKTSGREKKRGPQSSDKSDAKAAPTLAEETPLVKNVRRLSETTKEREKRLKAEEEKKRWEGVDDEFYEMLKDCVELV